jgi:Ni/Co efflux regulator RcnB
VKKTAMMIAALAFAGLMGTQASAAPLSKAAGATQSAAQSDVVQVRHHKKHRHYKKRHHRGAYNWRNDRRYYRYRSWNRYGSRPYNWRSRGCVAVGPVWFCK